MYTDCKGYKQPFTYEQQPTILSGSKRQTRTIIIIYYFFYNQSPLSKELNLRHVNTIYLAFYRRQHFKPC